MYRFQGEHFLDIELKFSSVVGQSYYIPFTSLVSTGHRAALAGNMSVNYNGFYVAMVILINRR